MMNVFFSTCRRSLLLLPSLGSSGLDPRHQFYRNHVGARTRPPQLPRRQEEEVRNRRGVQRQQHPKTRRTRRPSAESAHHEWHSHRAHSALIYPGGQQERITRNWIKSGGRSCHTQQNKKLTDFWYVFWYEFLHLFKGITRSLFSSIFKNYVVPWQRHSSV